MTLTLTHIIYIHVFEGETLQPDGGLPFLLESHSDTFSCFCTHFSLLPVSLTQYVCTLFMYGIKNVCMQCKSTTPTSSQLYSKQY